MVSLNLPKTAQPRLGLEISETVKKVEWCVVLGWDSMGYVCVSVCVSVCFNPHTLFMCLVSDM